MMKMTWTTILATTTLALALALAQAASGQNETRPAGQEVIRDGGAAEEPPSEVALLRGALEELITLLKQSLDMQEVGVLLRRLELTEARVAPLRAEVNGASEKVRSIEEETTMLRTEVERVTDLLSGTELSAREGQADALRNQREYARNRLRMLGRQEAVARQALYELQSQLERETARIRALNEWVDQRLGL